MKKVSSSILIGIFVLMLSTAAGISGCSPLFDYSEVIHENWGISLPGEARCSEIYSRDSGASFQGDGIRYHVFSYKKTAPVKEMLSWQRAERETRYHKHYSDAAGEWLDEIEVPSKDRPDYNECLYWYDSQEDGSEIIILWDKSESRLYVIESFL